jgi:hypothetical protein
MTNGFCCENRGAPPQNVKNHLSGACHRSLALQLPSDSELASDNTHRVLLKSDTLRMGQRPEVSEPVAGLCEAGSWRIGSAGPSSRELTADR